jgi:hypothetical protein
LRNILFILLLATASAAAQKTDSSKLLLIKEYNIIATDFNVDQMGNIYVLSKNNQLKKYNDKGDSIAVYNLSKRNGKLTAIDVTNPLKLLLYFKDFSTIITTDRLLQVTNTIDLRKFNIYQVNTIATSYDGQYWFYDEQEAKIKKINDQGKITQQTVDLRQVLKKLPTPQKIINNDNLLYVYDKQQGVFVFDYYGALKKTVPFNNCENVYIYNQTIYGFNADTLYKQNTTQNKSIKIPIPVLPKIIKTVVASGNIYFLHSKGIYVYKN